MHGTGVNVWDPLVRSLHWLLAGAVLANLFLTEEGEVLHQWLGYTAAGVVALRLAWGVVGTRYARFDGWFPTPGRVYRYMSALIAGREETYPGHNPLAALMILAMIALVAGLGLSGYLLEETDRFWGSEAVEELHEALAATLQVLVALHVLAAMFHQFWLRDGTLMSMIHGRKRLRADTLD